MKEFDFDELDKAVNSLMSTMPANGQAAAKSDDDIQTVTLPTTDEPAREKLPTEDFEHHNTTSLDDGAPKVDDTADETQLTTATDDEPAAASTTDTQPAATITPRRSGRFMDMVHASGDPTKVKKAPSELPTRVGRTVAPSSGAPIVDVMKPKTPESAAPASHGYVGGSSIPQPTQDEPTSDENGSGEGTSAETTSTEDAAKMMSTHGSTLTPLNPDVVPEALPAKEEAPAADVPESTDEPNAEQPSTEVAASPFLPDAKVEKRPLGGATSDDTMSQSSSEVVPAELSSDLMAIEAGENSSQIDFTPPAPQPEQPTPAPVSETHEALAEKPATPAVAAQPEAVVESGPISIPQQYQEEPNSGDQSNGAIYDTASYHQPLAHPAKKKSGWWIVLLILLIILIGAGAGAFAYFQGYF